MKRMIGGAGGSMPASDRDEMLVIERAGRIGSARQAGKIEQHYLLLLYNLKDPFQQILDQIVSASKRLSWRLVA